MSIKWFSSKKLNDAGQGQDLQAKSKPWLSAFIFLLTVVLTVGFAIYKDDLLLAAKYEETVVYSLNSARPKATNIHTAVTVSNRLVKTATTGSPNYQFTADTGYKLLLISFQPKEAYQISDSLETTIGDEYANDMYLLSGYTVTSKFEDLAYRDGMQWSSLGKIYAEYGTLGLSGVNGENKQALISDIIDKDFPDASLDTVSNIELLNGLAYRSNVITSDLICRSLIYVPRDAAVYDNTLTKAASYWSNSKNDSSGINMAPWMYGLLNKQMAISHSEEFRSGTSSKVESFGFKDNYTSLANAMLTAFDASKTYEQKKQAADYLENAIACAWPVLINAEESVTEQLGPLMTTEDKRNTVKIKLGRLNPTISDTSKDKEKYWKSPFLSTNYYIEDTLHKNSASESTYLQTITTLLDSDKEFLDKYKAGALDEEQLHLDLMEYYTAHPDMAYAVLDAVFGNISEQPVLAMDSMTIENWDIDNFSHNKYTLGFTEYIDFEARMVNWLVAGLNNYDAKDVNRELRVAGIRQAQLNCAIGYILQQMHPGMNVDTHSNVEIRLVDVYSNQGSISYSDKKIGKPYINEISNKIAENGWGAWDIILGLPNTGYCTTYETLASNFYDFDTLSENKAKVTTFASASLMYAKNYKFGIPTTEGGEVIVGGKAVNSVTSANDTVLDALLVLGSKKYLIGETGVSYNIGIDALYEQAFSYKKETANLALTDMLRQSYLSTLYARGRSAVGTQDLVYNYVGLVNIGFVRETNSLQTAFTGMRRSGLGLIDFAGKGTTSYANSKNVMKIGMSRYSITLKSNLPSTNSYYTYRELMFNGEKLKLSSSNLANNAASEKLTLEWDTSQTFNTAAGAFVLRTATKYNDIKLVVHPKDGTNYEIESSYPTVDSIKFNNNQPYDTIRIDTNRITTINYAAAYLYKMAFTTYSPTADTIGDLNEEETDLITTAQDNTTCANGYFNYLYNRCFYKKADTVEVHAVLGFREKTSKEFVVQHDCAPTKVNNYNLVLGVNLSKGALEALEESLAKEGTTAKLTIALGGLNDGKLAYFSLDGTEVIESEFDTTLLTQDGKELFAKKGFGQLKKYVEDWYTISIKPRIKDQSYVKWGNRTGEGYEVQSLTSNTDSSKGTAITIELTKAQIKEWLEDDKYAESDTFHKSDTEFMLVVKEWPADFFAGQNGKRLATVDGTEKLAINYDYTFGVECQLAVEGLLDEAGSSKLSLISVYDTTTLDKDTDYYLTLGSGLYSGLYGSTVTGASDKTTKIIAVRDTELMPDAVDNAVAYCLANTAYGEGTDNHVYFRFAQPETKQWQFTGKAMLRWVNSDDPKFVNKSSGDGKTLDDTITSTMSFEFDGGETTIKEFYDTLTAEGVKYIIVSIAENTLATEGSYEPKDKNNFTAEELGGNLSDLKGDVKGMTDALQKFNAGSVVYTLDEFIEILGGKDSENTSGNFKITDKYINTYTSSLIGVAPKKDNASKSNEFDANRLEFSFIAAIYGAGTNGDLANAVKESDRQVGTYLTTALKSEATPLFDLTNGLGYILNPMSTSDFQNSKDYVRYNAAMNKEIANLKLLNPGQAITATQTRLYELLAENKDIIVWTHQNAKEGYSYQVKNGTVFEGTGLRDKQSANISLGDDKKSGGDAWVAAIYKDIPAPVLGNHYIVRTSSPVAYTQLKNGTWTDEAKAEQTWNTLTGIPSTETFYVSSGGSEFIIEMIAADVAHERAYRSYISHFAQNDCKFKPGDIASAGGGTVTSVNKNNISHALNVTSSVGTLTDKFSLPAPVGYSSASYTVSAHGGNTITATWTGTIENTTANPGIQHTAAPVDMISAIAGTAPVQVNTNGNGYTYSTSVGPGGWFSGYPGEMTNQNHPNKQHLAGTAGGDYSWNVSKYNTAIDQAYTWAKALETASDGAGNVIITSNSDEKVRSWHIGDAVINVTLTNVNSATNAGAKVTFAHEGKGLPKTTYTTDDVTKMAYTGGGGGAKLETNDDTLSSGWFEVYGSKEQFNGASSCNSSHPAVTGQTGRATVSWGDESALNTWQSQGHPQQIPYSYVSSYNQSHTAASGETPCGGDSCTPVTTDSIYPEEFWCSNNPGSWVDAEHTHNANSETVDGPGADGCPGHGTDEEGNPNECTCTHTVYSCDHEVTASKAANTHTCSASHSASGYKQTTLKQSGTVSYKIVVTFKDSYTQGDQKVTTPGGNYPKHSCCGPCCEHVLPAISDEWVQWISYSTVRISDIRVNKISRSYVEGQNDLTLDFKDDDYLIGDIQQGDVNVFYNIATENATYKKSVYTDHNGYNDTFDGVDGGGYASVLPSSNFVIDGASLAGRIRYSEQAQQHDTVLWREYNQLNETKRTSECDGQARKTVADHYNPSPDGGEGHWEDWALGILYRRSNSASDTYYVASATAEDQYNTKFTHAAGWLTGDGDGKFNTAVMQADTKKAAYANNTVDEVDKATWEYQRFVYRRNTLNTVNVMSDVLILQGTQSGDNVILYKANTSAGKTTEQDHYYDKDGLKTSIKEVFPTGSKEIRKYKYEGQTGPKNFTNIEYQVLENISTSKSKTFGGYNSDGSNDKLETHTALGTTKATTYLDSNGSVFDATVNHPDPYAGVAAPRTYAKVTTVDNSTNPALFKTSAALYQQRIERPTTPLRIGKLNIQIDPTMQNQLHVTEKATQTWFQIIDYTEPDVKTAKYDVSLSKEYYEPTKTFENVKVFTQESYYYGETSTGWLDTKYKVNDIVIHSPISSTNNYLLQDVDFYDQRLDMTNLSHDNNTKGCPSSSLLCEYSYFDCSYLEEKVLFNMDFDSTYSRVDSHGNTNTGNTFAVDTYGYITTITETANFIVVPVKTGLVTRVNTAAHGSGININGTSLSLPLNTIGAQYTTGTQVKLVLHGAFSANTKMFECGNVKATIISNGLKVTNGEAEYIFSFNNATSYHTYELVIDYDGLDKFTLKVDGKNINKSAGTPIPDTINVQFDRAHWSDTMKIGERCTLYTLQLVHLPGTATCTDGCYDSKFECQELWNYTCDTATKFTGTALPHKYTASIEGTYLIELYDGAGNYQSQKIHLDKGESIYAYLGSKGYWSYSGTDKASTSTSSKEYVDKQVGVENATILNPPTTVLDKTTGSSSITLKPGVYYLETEGKQGKVSGYYTVTNNTTLYYGVGEESWINTSNSKTNAVVHSGTPGVPGKPAVPGSHTHTSSCPKGYTNYRLYSFTGCTAVSCYTTYGWSRCDYCGFSDSYTDYFTDSARTNKVLRSGEDKTSCSCPGQVNGTQVWFSGTSQGTGTLYAESSYTCNNLPLNTGGTAAVPEVPAKAGYAASSVENVVITPNTGATAVKQATLNIGSAYSSGTGTSYTITNYASSKRLTTDDNASWYNSSRSDSPSTDYYTCPLYGSYGGFYWANKVGSNNRYYANDQTYTFNEESDYGGVIDMRFTTGCLTGSLTLTNFKPILVKKDGTVVTGLIDTLITQGYITAKCAYSNAGSHTPFATPANIFNGSSLGSNNWASIAFAFELSDDVKMKGFSANCSTHSKPGDCYSAVHYADTNVQEFETSVKILKYVDLSSYTDISNVANTYADALITDKINVTPLNPAQVVFNNNTNTTTTIAPGIYLLEAIDEDGKGTTGIYHTLTTKTLYHGNSESGHWINTTNSGNTSPLVSAKKGTDAVYEYTDMTRSAYDDDSGDGYNCKMTAPLTEGTYILCNGTFSAMRQMTTYKDGDYLGSISCTFTYKINGTTYYMYGAGSVSITVPAGQTWTVTCSTNDSSATAQSIDPYTAVFKAGTKTLVTPAVPGTYTASNVTSPNTAYTTTDSARTRITKLVDLSSYSNMKSVTYNTPTSTSVNNVVLTCEVAGKKISTCKVTCITEVKVTQGFTNYTYKADTSKIILSNAGSAPIVFEYTGNVQAVTLEPGTYRLEAWGASSGGSGTMVGEGGYTAGTVTFDKTTTLYVYVGERGNGTVHGQYGTATFNGGGAGYRNGADNVTHNGVSGGGATDIRVTDGIWYNDASLKSRILVAGGGGGYGCASSHNPGHGGGLTGATTLNTSGSYAGASAGGGSQTAPGKGVGNWAAAYGPGEGKFGIGATGEQCAAGGGGGYYGGGTEYTAGGGGGSSYVSGYTGCDTTYLANQKVNGSNVTFKDVVLQQGGNIGNGRVRITKVGVASTTKYETSNSDGYTWVKVFAHDTNGGYFNANTALHTGTPTSMLYSILDEIDLLRTAGESKYVFKLVYPETGQTNIWKQSYKPQDENVPDGNGTKDVTGFEAIRTDMDNNYWGGLALSTSSRTFIDGSINHNNWWYAIGSYIAHPSGSTAAGDTIPGGNSTNVTKVELWLATDLTKVNAAAGTLGVGASGDHILNSTVTTTTTCPVESPYYWFQLGQKTNVAQIRLVHDEHTASCTKVKNTNNYHTHVAGCFGGTPAYNYLLNAAQNNSPELNVLCLKYLGVSKTSLGNVYNALINKSFDYANVPDSVDGHDNPILNCYNHNTEHVHVQACKTNNKTSICNNIHHQGEHYDFGHPLCYEPCKDNELHNPTKVEIDDESLYIGSAMNLNGYFNVYWDNYGDFYDTGDVGSLVPSSEKGQGYENNMDTTRWLKRKVIVFNDIDVLFYDETSKTWNLYKAGTEIDLPITKDDANRDWRDANQEPITVYSFYCLLNNNEYSKTAFQAWTEGLNSPSSEGQGDRPYDKLKERHADLTAKDTNFYRNEDNSIPPFSALHSTKHYHLFDVVGQIGNMIITYTTDPRWSNFFKQADTSAGWQVENLLYEVVPDNQSRYLYIGRESNGTFRDIRNHEITSTTQFFDTWNNESWKHSAVLVNSILEPDLLAKQTAYTWSKLADDLKCGYDIYCEITTTGDYTSLDVEYKYYVFDRDTGEVSEVDLWSKVDSSYLAYYLADEDATQIQQIIDQDSLGGYYGIESTKSLALYHLYVDLATEYKLRMVTAEQMLETSTLAKELDKTLMYTEVPFINEEGEIEYLEYGAEVEGTGLSLEQVNIGTAYGVMIDARSRILTGSSYDNWGLRDYSNGIVNFTYPRTIMDTNLGNQINPSQFTTQARRWLFTAGLAENTVAVKYNGVTHVDLTTQSTHESIITDYDRYAILVGVNIKARGNVWYLEYEAFKNPQRVLGKNLDTKYPDIIAVYGLSSKEDDFDVQQSH